MFGHPPYIWMSLIHLDAPIHLAASKHTGVQPNICRVSKHTEGCPNIWGHTTTQGCPNIGGTQTYRASKHGRCPNIQVDIQTYVGVQTWGHPNIQGVSKHMGASKHTGGHPNIWWYLNIQEASKHGGIQTYGGSQMYGGIWTPLMSDKACFLCVVYVQGASKHHSNIWGASKHMGCPNLGHPNIQRVCKHTGASKLRGPSKHMVASLQEASKYREHPNIWG